MYHDLIEAIKAKNTLVFVETTEEEELAGVIKNVCRVINYGLVEWNPIDNYKDITPQNVVKPLAPMSTISDLFLMLGEIGSKSNNNRAVYFIKDISFFIHQTTQRENLAVLVRNLKNLKYSLKNTDKTIIVCGRRFDLPAELEDDFKIIQHKRPDEKLLNDIFIDFIASNNLSKHVSANQEQINEIVKSAKGLTADQFRDCIALSLIKNGNIGIKTLDEVLENKKQIIRKRGILEYIDESVSMTEVGGLDNIKDWIRKRQKAFMPAAREKGLPEPKAILVFGVPGTGKSLVAKAISSVWRRPILRFDIGRVFGSFVGESDRNLREALATAESVAPCILWIDELEKAFAGASGGHETTVRVLGNFLTWMQEKQSEIFIVATANDITQLPAEYLRKGRFDELFFVGLPNRRELKEIIEIQLKKYKLNVHDFNINNLISIFMDRNTGAEIEQSIIEAKYNAFDKDREPNEMDIREAVSGIRPIYSMFQERMASPNYRIALESAKKASKED